MIRLAVSRTSLGFVPLIAEDTGRSGGVIIDWQPGDTDPQNEFSESAWLDGAPLARTRIPNTTAVMRLRLYASSVAAVRTLHATWRAALIQQSFTITESYTGGSITYECFPAKVSPVLEGPMLAQGVIVLTASIPRRP